LKNRIAVLESYIREKGQQLPSPGLVDTTDGGMEDGEGEGEDVDGVSTTMLHLHVSPQHAGI
jgi:hypothetical protein